jgi:hypothetical protein
MGESGIATGGALGRAMHALSNTITIEISSNSNMRRITGIPPACEYFR